MPHSHTGVLEALWLWREQEAQNQDRPPFKIVNNPALINLALRQPTTVTQLAQIQGLGPSEIQRYGGALLQAIREGKKRPPPTPPEPTQRLEQWLDRPTLDRYDALRQWRSKTAASRGVMPEIVLTNDVLLEIAKRQPRTLEELREIDAIGPWKPKTYGPDLLRLAQR